MPVVLDVLIDAVPDSLPPLHLGHLFFLQRCNRVLVELFVPDQTRDEVGLDIELVRHVSLSHATFPYEPHDLGKLV